MVNHQKLKIKKKNFSLPSNFPFPNPLPHISNQEIKNGYPPNVPIEKKKATNVSKKIKNKTIMKI